MKPKVFVFWFVLVMLAMGRVYMSMNERGPDLSSCLKQTVEGRGRVGEEPVRGENGQSLVVDIDQLKGGPGCALEKEGRFVRIKMKTKLYPVYAYGDNVMFAGKINIPFNFSSANGRSFDYKGFLAKDDIYYEMKSAQVSKEVGAKSGLIGSLIGSLYHLKLRFVSNLERVLGEPHAALAAGLVVGEKSALGKDLLGDFRTVGLIHIVVLSGFNITIVADAIRRLLSFLPRVWGIILGGAGIILFGIMVGGGSTVVRSCIMATIALSADLIRRDYNVIRALILAGFIMIIISPSILLHDPSFQLSFLATLGLIFLASPIEKRLQFLTERFGLRGIVASTFATQIFVSPFILYTMGQISIIGVAANILVLPFIPFTMLFVFLAGSLGFISTLLSQIIGWVAHFLLSYEIFMVEHFARLPFAAVNVPAFSFSLVITFYIAFFIIYYFVSRRLGSSRLHSNSG